jgi:hypothetical protein
VLVLRKKSKSIRSSCGLRSLSISLAIANTPSLSALSSVKAKRRIAKCQERNVLVCHPIGRS